MIAQVQGTEASPRMKSRRGPGGVEAEKSHNILPPLNPGIIKTLFMDRLKLAHISK